MKYEVAESILKSTMTEWDALEANQETKDIQIISEIKYDDYQQYTHGMRYVESLALWMRQFRKEERKKIYEFIKNSLIYISEEEMRQLVAFSFPLVMKKYILEKTKIFCQANKISDVEYRKETFSYFRRCSMFLGLSDGAHVDFFRRQNSYLSNEQIFIHYDFSSEKANDMVKYLSEDRLFKKFREQYKEQIKPKFCSFFLIDDFAGSGKSYIRYEREKGWCGKIYKFYKQIIEGDYATQDADIHIILYVATRKALSTIKDQINIFLQNERRVNRITVEAVQIIESIDFTKDEAVYRILKDNYDAHSNMYSYSFVDSHFIKGEGTKPYLGFADCALPLILYHNTPNNSLPVLWYTWGDNVDALFPRVTRHKEVK